MARVPLTADSECSECGGTGVVYVDGEPPDTLCICVRAESVSPAPTPPSESVCATCGEYYGGPWLKHAVASQSLLHAKDQVQWTPPTPPPNPERNPALAPPTSEGDRKVFGWDSKDPIEWWADRPTRVAMFTNDPAARAEIVAVVRAADAWHGTDDRDEDAMLDAGIRLERALNALRAKLREQMEGE